MEQRASLCTHPVNYRSKARRGIPTMNNEITQSKVCMETDFLMISLEGEKKKSRLVPLPECFEDKCSEGRAR